MEDFAADGGDNGEGESGEGSGDHAAGGTLASEEGEESRGGHAQSNEYSPAPDASGAAVSEEHGECGDHEHREARILEADVDVSAGGAEDDGEQVVEQVGLFRRDQSNILIEVRRAKVQRPRG